MPEYDGRLVVDNMGVIKNEEHTGARRLNIIFKIVNAAVIKSYE